MSDEDFMLWIACVLTVASVDIVIASRRAVQTANRWWHWLHSFEIDPDFRTADAPAVRRGSADTTTSVDPRPAPAGWPPPGAGPHTQSAVGRPPIGGGLGQAGAGHPDIPAPAVGVDAELGPAPARHARLKQPVSASNGVLTLTGVDPRHGEGPVGGTGAAGHEPAAPAGAS